jgi:serine/threonine-protein kinase RsbW
MSPYEVAVPIPASDYGWYGLKNPCLLIEKSMSELKLPAKIENLQKLMRFVSGFAKEEGFTPKTIQQIELATEEALINIFNYAYPDDETGAVEVRCRMEDQSSLVIDLLDTGKPFDVQSVPEPDLTLDVSERKLGGLGIYLIKKMVSRVHYRREGQRVRFFTKTLSPRIIAHTG